MFTRLFPLALAGCATTWITTQATGTQRVWDEGVNEVHVPQPGVEEHIVVTMPLTSAAIGSAAQPLALTCAVDQTGRDLVYHQAFRYGSRWKKMTALAFVLEGALGAALFLSASNDKPDGYVYGGFLGLDAVLTAPLIFIPRKEIYRTDDVAVTTPVRGDCPDGLALEIGGDSFPVDASGHLGDLGDAALAQWKPGAPIRATIAGQERDLVCGPQTCTTTIPVATGTLTSMPVVTRAP
jgi:hypothetical protein